MSTPRRPTAGRRPARPGARPSRTTRVPTRTPTPPVAGRQKREPGTPRRSLLTPRAAVLALVVAGLLASAALPLREYLRQRSEIAGLQAEQAAARERIAALEAERERLQDPAYIAAEARRRLHFVLPGETAYVVLAPEELPAEQAEKAEAAASPWYSQLWSSVQEADRPAPAPAP
jgi:cell division protein FtsB